MIRLIREEEPSKPSTRLSGEASLPSLAALRQTEPRKLMTMLRGELDWVVMKCLEKSRERRYETANGLARDLQRYLADEPVEARPQSAGYRLGKLLRRHKGPALAAALILALRDRGCGILLVEHDLEQVNRICDEVVVLVLGETLMRGTPAEVSADADVRRLYLGEEVEVT